MGEAKRCPQCGVSLKPGSGICTSCGAPAADVREAAGVPADRQSTMLFWILAGTGLLILVLIIVSVSISGRGPAGPAAPGPDALSGEGGAVEPLRFTDYTNRNFSFATRLPRNWQGTVTGEELVFSGLQATEQFLTTVKFRFVTNTMGNTLEGQTQELEDEWSRMKAYRILSREPFRFEGNPAIRMVAEYDGPEDSGAFRQDQIIVDRGLYYYYIAYTAPVPLFDKYKFVMDELVDSFKFTR